MAERWQQWMPLHIDRLRGSPEVQAMHPCARQGYIWLLLSQWQSEDGTISSDDLDLATDSGLGDELWAQYKIRVLRKFDPVEGSNRLRNLVNYEEWLHAKQVFEARQEAARKTTKVRSPRKNGTVTVPKADGDHNGDRSKNERSADTITGTYTGTETNTKHEVVVGEPTPSPKRKKTPSPKDKPSEGKEPVLFTQFKDLFDRYYRSKNFRMVEDKREEKPAPWDGREGGALSRFMKANPTVTLEDWKTILTNRWHSPCTHADRLSKWVDNALSWLNGQARDFGRPITGGPSYDKGVRAEQSVREHRAKHAGEQRKNPGSGLLDLLNAQPGTDGRDGRNVLAGTSGPHGRADPPTHDLGGTGNGVLPVPRTIEASVGDTERGGESEASAGGAELGSEGRSTKSA